MDSIQYTARQGDMFDAIALKYYGDSKYAVHIINANVEYADVLIFDGGEVLTVPRISTAQTVTKPPWRQA